ncbi:MAG: tyrosine phosphatase family protein [Hyphomicrobiales bacterium]|nr:tyrosine phosphatase family protein [Hyphomicrobiales bacterium]
MIWVCPLSKVEATVASSQAERLLSLLAPGTAMVRPAAIAEQNHLWLSLHDIAEPQEGMTLPGRAHMRTLIDFAQSWDRAKPLVINCYAGISRSTASAYIIAAALQPSRDELELAQTLRLKSPSATPNPRLIALADEMLGRRGRMVDAVRSIGRGADAFEGVPFSLDVGR